MEYIIKITEVENYPYNKETENTFTFETDKQAWEFFYERAFNHFRGIRDFFSGWHEDEKHLVHYCEDEAGVTKLALCKWEDFDKYYREDVIDIETKETWSSIKDYLNEHPTKEEDLWKDDDNAYRLIGSVFVDRFYKDSEGVDKQMRKDKANIESATTIVESATTIVESANTITANDEYDDNLSF